MTPEGDLKDIPQSVKKKEEAPFWDFVINTGVNERQSMTDFLPAWFQLSELVILGLETRFFVNAN